MAAGLVAQSWMSPGVMIHLPAARGKQTTPTRQPLVRMAVLAIDTKYTSRIGIPQARG
jgi:hypothetical protein